MVVFLVDEMEGCRLWISHVRHIGFELSYDTVYIPYCRASVLQSGEEEEFFTFSAPWFFLEQHYLVRTYTHCRMASI